jgi:hypothetical protein
LIYFSDFPDNLPTLINHFLIEKIAGKQAGTAGYDQQPTAILKPAYSINLT